MRTKLEDGESRWDTPSFLAGVALGTMLACLLIISLNDKLTEKNKMLTTQVQCLKSGNYDLTKEVKRLQSINSGVSDLPKFTVDNWKVVIPKEK